MTDTLASDGQRGEDTRPRTPPPQGKARGRHRTSPEQEPPEKKHKKQVVLYEDTQELLWQVSDRLGMENDPTIKAALRLLLKDCERRGIRRKSNAEIIDEILGDES